MSRANQSGLRSGDLDMEYWLDWAGIAAAGGVGGLIYWSFVERELILLRVRRFLRLGRGN